VRTRSAALIGRAAELATLTRWLHEPGGPRAGFCLGTAGVGKSRLVAEVAAQAAASGLVVVHGRASSVGPVSPLRPFAEALAALHRRGLLPEDNLGGYRPLLARVVPQVPGPGRLGVGEAVPTVAFAEAVLRVLAAVAAPAGCLLVLEDLHDADPESLAVLDYLLDHIANTPIAIVGALRDEPTGTRETLATAEQRGVAELVPIRPLDREHTGLLVATCLASDQPPDDLVELAWRHSGGNPLLVEELLYDLIDVGQLRADGERWCLVAGSTPPPSMVQLVAARIERLGCSARQLLVTAAVYGERFPLPAVEAAVQASEIEFGEAIEGATAAQLFVAAEPGWCRFHHPLSHAAVLELVSVAERRQAATRLAEAVLAEDPERSSATCRVAGRLRAEAGELRAAGELYARTGREAYRAGTLAFAVADLTEALRLLPSDESVSGDLVTVLLDSWQLAPALELVDRLPPAAGPDRERRALIHLDLAWSCHLAGRRPEGQQQLASAQALISGTGSELARIHCDVVEICLEGDLLSWQAVRAAIPRARTVAEAAERFARTTVVAAERRSAAEAACRGWLSVQVLSGAEEEGFERITDLAGEHNLPGWEFMARMQAADQRLLTEGDPSLLRAVHTQAQQLGMVGQALALETYLWVQQVQLAEGSLAPVLAGLAGCLEQARRMRVHSAEGVAIMGLIVAAGFRADRTAMAEAVARLDAAGHPHRASGAAAWIQLTFAVCLALEGRDREALDSLVDSARQHLAEPNDELAPPYALVQLLGTVAGTIQPAEVAAALETASRLRWCRQFLHAAAAVHAGRQGDRPRADQHATQARAAAEVYPVTRHLIARLVAPAAAADGWGNPIEDLRAAEAWFDQQGITAAARNCRDVLRTLGASLPQRRDGTEAVPAELRTLGVTTREYEVGQLLAERLTNRVIGERLHISPRTVEKHIAALISKLAVPDRHAVISRLTDHHYSPR
jgi:DNA-binding CsgD family transcriptional regulator